MKELQEFGKRSLGVFPTPIQKLENISRILGTNVYIKRDDMTGVGLGGNKVRKLEYLLYDAKMQGAEIVFTTGWAQSNHAMLTAACAKKMGMTPILILKKRGVTDCKGNLFLEQLMGIDVRLMDTGDAEEIYREMDRVGRETGKKYYKIPTGGSNGLGALGYVDCVREIREQSEKMQLSFQHIVCADGSGGTHAGLALGCRLYLPQTQVHGMMVDSDPFEEITTAIINEAMHLMELEDSWDPSELILRDCSGAGYSIPSKEGNDAIRMMAENEGIFLDPVYTGKAFAGLIQMAGEGAFGPEDNVLFLYSGGAGGLFAIDMETGFYADERMVLE